MSPAGTDYLRTKNIDRNTPDQDDDRNAIHQCRVFLGRVNEKMPTPPSVHPAGVCGVLLQVASAGPRITKNQQRGHRGG